jgi:hypothetical protein
MNCCHLSSPVTQSHDHLVMTGRRTMACTDLHSDAEPHLGLARRALEAQRGVKSRGDFTTLMSSGVVVGDVLIVHLAGRHGAVPRRLFCGTPSSVRTTRAVALAGLQHRGRGRLCAVLPAAPVYGPSVRPAVPRYRIGHRRRRRLQGDVHRESAEDERHVRQGEWARASHERFAGLSMQWPRT